MKKIVLVLSTLLLVSCSKDKLDIQKDNTYEYYDNVEGGFEGEMTEEEQQAIIDEVNDRWYNKISSLDSFHSYHTK